MTQAETIEIILECGGTVPDDGTICQNAVCAMVEIELRETGLHYEVLGFDSSECWYCGRVRSEANLTMLHKQAIKQAQDYAASNITLTR